MRLEIRIDDQLRERPVDVDAAERLLDDQLDDLVALRSTLVESRDELERTRLGRVLNRLGYAAMLLDHLVHADVWLVEALAIWRDVGRRRATFLAELRCCELALARADLADAIAAADNLVGRSRHEPFGIYRDFALDLRGRVHLRRRERERGLDDLRRAWRLRREEGRERLVERLLRIFDQVDASPPDA